VVGDSVLHANAKSDTVKINRGAPQGSVLGSLFFYIFLNDPFYFVTEAKLSNYADDNQLTSSLRVTEPIPRLHVGY